MFPQSRFGWCQLGAQAATARFEMVGVVEFHVCLFGDPNLLRITSFLSAQDMQLFGGHNSNHPGPFGVRLIVGENPNHPTHGSTSNRATPAHRRKAKPPRLLQSASDRRRKAKPPRPCGAPLLMKGGEVGWCFVGTSRRGNHSRTCKSQSTPSGVHMECIRSSGLNPNHPDPFGAAYPTGMRNAHPLVGEEVHRTSTIFLLTLRKEGKMVSVSNICRHIA